jgi:hypothetical protein
VNGEMMVAAEVLAITRFVDAVAILRIVACSLIVPVLSLFILLRCPWSCRSSGRALFWSF